MNSRTSRPRSPTSAITLTWALVDLAIMPSNEDFPTPEPAKMPKRCPRPQGTSASSARTPRPTRSQMRGLDSAPGGGATVERSTPPGSGPSSSGRPKPSTTRPSRSEPTATRNGAPVASTRVPGPMPCISPSPISKVRPSLKPTTSAGMRPFVGSSLPIEQTSPTSACRPVASMIRPIRLHTLPWRLDKSASRSAWVAVVSRPPGEGCVYREGDAPLGRVCACAGSRKRECITPLARSPTTLRRPRARARAGSRRLHRPRPPRSPRSLPPRRPAHPGGLRNARHHWL